MTEAPGAEGLSPIWLSALVALWELRSSGAGGPALRGSLDRLWDSGRGLATYLRRCPSGAPAAPSLTAALEDALVTTVSDRAMMKDDAGEAIYLPYLYIFCVPWLAHSMTLKDSRVCTIPFLPQL